MRPALALTIGLLLAPAALADPVSATASAHVDASPERVLAVLADFESWGHVFESVETIGAERQDEHRALVRQRVHRAGFTLAYRLAATVDLAAHRVDLVLDPREPGQMAELASSWSVAPHPSGGSIITLRVLSRSKLPVPAFIERAIAERTTRDSIDELVRALERVAASQGRVGEG